MITVKKTSAGYVLVDGDTPISLPFTTEEKAIQAISYAYNPLPEVNGNDTSH